MAPDASTATLPLVGLHEDTLLPGEERTFRAPAVDAATREALGALVDQLVVTLTVTGPVELPAFAGGRCGTVAGIVSVGAEQVVLRGVRRVRVTSARGSAPPFAAAVAEVVPGAEANAERRVTELLAAAGKVVASLAGGARPARAVEPAELELALGQLVRALGDAEDLKAVHDLPLPAALERLAARLAGAAETVAALRALERAVLETRAPVSPELKRRLWSQCVELMRRLDVHDPTKGSDEGDVARLQRRLMQAGLDGEARDTAKRELRLLRSMETRHHDYPMYLQHLEWMARLPWHADTLPPPDLDAVAAALDAEHHGLEAVKRRILEYLAVRHLGGRAASTVLCLAGPPGVGKTTIARAIAGALGRRFATVALGGVHQESELRGHRITYTAAQPGRIVHALAHAGQANALLLLDEIDKLGTDTSRSPTGALLEILDPEQHHAFRDHYLGVPIDLSNVLFVCTANDAAAIHPILRDRLEVVELEGYSEQEKLRIARAHLLRRLAKDHGLPDQVHISDGALTLVVSGHTREAGVRELARQLAKVYRDRALAAVQGRPRPEVVDEAEIARILGRPRHVRRAAERFSTAGVANGLSVSADGGQLLPIEASLGPGDPKLRLTGRMGEVMRESVEAARTHLRHRGSALGVPSGALEGEVHVHAPEGAVPKDGPSAGVAVFAALLSAATGRRARGDVAMTGEITLHGRVLPVGGVRAKLLAAERSGILRVVVPAENLADVPEGLSCEVVAVRDLAEVPPLVLEE